ncbi:MAG: ArdC family protein [Planctomycetota bacterium]|nr:ArdC family protein [Planctomycetota bacterium]
MSGAEKTRKLVDEKLDELAAALEAGQSESLRQYLAAMGRFHRYSLGNILLIEMARPDATHVAGYRTWQQLGRQVRQGEKGIQICAPVVVRQKKETESEEDRVVAFRGVTVFDINQTDGRPLPEFAKAQGDPGEHIERLKQLIAARGIALEYAENTHGAEGLFTDGKIVIRSGLTPAEEFSVLTHETAHALLHGSPESRSLNKTVVETEAEAVAFVVGAGVGLDLGSSSADYVSLYDGKKETLLESLEQIRRVAAEIINALTASDEAKARDIGVPAEHAVAA